MNKHIRKPSGKEIRPAYYIFCEGESEEAYISFLKNYYRVPIQLIPKITKNSINEKYITTSLKQYTSHEKDKTFLFYDIDVKGMLAKLQSIKNTTLLASNPCLELWYLLHFVNQSGQIKTKDCIDKLERIIKGYSKGKITSKLRLKLIEKVDDAIKKSKKLKAFSNPSTNLYILLEDLKTLKDQK